jgi:hypothetical protein
MKQIILSLLLCGIVSAAPESPQWKIVKTKYPTSDTVVAGYNVLDFGALGDGQKDCTEAFQAALDSISKAGGGTVFVPEGRYAIKGTLQIPMSVTLRGDWAAPTPKSPVVKGTVLMAYAGRGETNGRPFISVGQCAGLKDLSIWYPEQTAQDIVAYPYCLIQTGLDNATFEDLTLVNPYQGIRIGPRGNELHYLHNVYGTPLSVGVRYNMTTDIGRLENVHFSPDYWSRSGLPNSPAANGPLAAWLLTNGTAFYMERSDWEYVSYVFIDGYHYGFLMTSGGGGANAQFYGMIIRNCQTAIEVQGTNPFGNEFANCTFQGIDYGFRLESGFSSAIMLSDCDVSAKQALYSEGRGCFIAQNSRINHGNIVLTGGVLTLTDSKIEDAKTQISLGANMQGASLVGNTFAKNSPPIKSELPAGKLFVSDKPVKLDPFPKFDGNETRVERPARDVLYVVTDAPWKADASGEQDATLAVQKALAQAGQDGGGIVFVPGGDYIIRDQLVVPSGVELRGIYDVPHHTLGGGSMLHIYPGTNQNPSVVLLARAGLRGLSFNYPDQTASALKEYPFLIQGHGADLYIINVNGSNPYQFLDLKTWRCDRHWVEYLSGSPAYVGVAVGGGSKDGQVRNMMFNTHYWARTPGGNRFFANARRGSIGNYQRKHLEALWVGHCQHELLYESFVYGSIDGIYFTQQEGRGPEDCIVLGHGTDGSTTGAYFERGTGRIDLINSELVTISSSNMVAVKLGPDFHGTARLINTMVWGTPETLAEVDNGSLWLQGLHLTQQAREFGDGIQVHQGEITAVNVNYTGASRSAHRIHLGLAGAKAKATLIGNITQGELMLTNTSTEASSQAPKPVLIGNVSR